MLHITGDMSMTVLQIIAAIFEEPQTSAMIADAETLIYTDGASEMLSTYFSCDIL